MQAQMRQQMRYQLSRSIAQALWQQLDPALPACSVRVQILLASKTCRMLPSCHPGRPLIQDHRYQIQLSISLLPPQTRAIRQTPSN